MKLTLTFSEINFHNVLKSRQFSRYDFDGRNSFFILKVKSVGYAKWIISNGGHSKVRIAHRIKQNEIGTDKRTI